MRDPRFYILLCFHEFITDKKKIDEGKGNRALASHIRLPDVYAYHMGVLREEATCLINM